MKRALLLAAVLLALGASGAEAHTTMIEPPKSHFPYQRWVNSSLIPTYAGTVELGLDPSPCGPLAEGCTVFEPGAVPIVNVASWTPKATLFHELGHVFDLENPSETLRLRFDAINGLAGEWEESPNPDAPGWAVPPPNEIFADAYMVCALERHPHFVYSPGATHAEYEGPTFTTAQSSAIDWYPLHWQFVKTCALLGR